MSDQVVNFKTKKIITMDHNNPEATHVVVRNGIILAVGDENCANGWSDNVVIDTSYEDKVMLPGLIEAHAHVSTGGVWDYIYCALTTSGIVLVVIGSVCVYDHRNVSISNKRTKTANFLPPIRSTFVAPGFLEPSVLGSGRLKILQIIMALEIEPTK